MYTPKTIMYTNPKVRTDEIVLLKAQFIITQDRLQAEQHYASGTVFAQNNITDLLTEQLLGLAEYLWMLGAEDWLMDRGITEVRS